MATSTNRRDYPNDYFAWYNDDKRLGIVWRSLTTSENEGTVAGEFDTYNDDTITSGITIHYHGHYVPINGNHDFQMKDTGLEAALFPALVCYIKSRLYEDLGDFNKAQYYRKMFMMTYNQYPLRKSGLRSLSVPKL